MSADQMLRDHVMAVVAVVQGLPSNVIRIKSPFFAVAGLASAHRLLQVRAFGMVAVMLLAAVAFWKLSKTEGTWCKTVAGVLILLAVWQIPGVAFVINECTATTPSWLWYLAGCWYL